VIAHLRGRVAHRDTSSVVVDVGGVGYLVHVTPSDRIPARGEDVELHTSLQVREESMTLFGFTERSSLSLFELLLTSSGVGPKLALAALGTHRPEVLRMAIAGGDLATLTLVPGIGKKVAERLVLELKDRVGGPGLGVPADAPGGVPVGDAAVLAEVRDALLALGYSAGEVQGAIGSLATAEGADTSTLLRAALLHLGSAGAHA
jgi:holliday junction DNA helicase RuvA